MGLLVYLGLVVLCIGDIKGAPSVPGNENEEAKVFSQDSPHFLSQPLDLVVDEGTAVRLPCMVDTLAGFQLIWRKNGRIITVGDQIVDKSESKISLEDSENGNTLVIEDVDETDEAHFSCSISTVSGAEIDHNLRVITRMSGNEMDHIAAENPQAVVLEEIENSEQGSGFVTDTNKNIIQIDQEPVFTDDKEQEEEIILDNKDASSVGKVYFARIPSFYTFTDDGNRDVTEREQLIKHAPKSVREFLKLLRTYQSSVLTKDDIQEFNEFVFEKKPIPNTHLLRSTHAYNSNLRKSLQSANIKEMESSKVIPEEDSQSIDDLKTESLQRVKSSSSSSREDVLESEERVKDNIDTASTQHVDTSRESQSSHEESQEEGSFGDNDDEDDELGSGKSDEELNASFSENHWKLDEHKTAQYSSGVRYLQGQNIGDVEEEGIDYISEDRKFPILRGQYLPKVDIEEYDLNPENFKEKITNIESEDKDDASFVTQLESDNFIGREADETRLKASEESENYEEIAENEDDASFVRKIESENVMGKKSDESKSKTHADEFIQINESGHDEKETDNEKLGDVHVDSKVKINWYESRPEHYVFADRYLQENEIGQLESEQDTGEEDSYIPLFRGQHLVKTDLEEPEAGHGEDADYESYNESEVLADTKESVKNVEAKDISNEEQVTIESKNEAEYTPESYFPLSCCLPETNSQESESVGHSKQVSNEKRVEIELQIEVEDKHGEESLEALSLEKKQESNEAFNKHGNNVQEKFTANNKESIAHIYGEANYEKDQGLSSSPRYLNEDEIEHIEDESVDLTQHIMIPVIRGRHLPEYTLEQLNEKDFEYIVEEDEESLRYKQSGKNVQIHSSDESEIPSKHVKPESNDIIETSNINQQEQSMKDSKYTSHIDMEKETLYPQEVKDIERSYFTQKPQEEKELSSGKHIKHKDGSNEVDEEMDPNKQATNHKISYDQDKKIEEEVVLVSSEDLHRNDVDEDATEIRIAQDREMVPLQVLLNEESKERVYEPTMRKKVISKERRRDGPHPFRFLCMLRKCGA